MQYTKLFTVLYCSTVLYSGTALHVVHCTDRNSRGEVGACGYVGSGYFLQRTRSVRRGVEFVVPCLPDTEPATPPEGNYTADRTPDAVEWFTIRSSSLPVSSCRKAQDVRWWLRDFCERRHKGLQKPTPQAEQDTVDLCRPVGCG